MYFILYLIVWEVEPVVTHQTTWLEAQAHVVCDKTKLMGQYILLD